jgi:hypothetical protein
MNKILLLTPDRDDRPEFLEHCRWQMLRQTLKPGAHFVINGPGERGVVDIVPRLKKGVKMAIENGFEYCFIIENDDYYPDDYLEKMMFYFNLWKETELLGIGETIYYSLQHKKWRVLTHPERSSLFCTAFRIQGLKNYQWPDDRLLYFDMHLWTYKCTKKLITFSDPPIGIKHGTGFCPGNYHNGIVNGKQAKNMNNDDNLMWLKEHVRQESFEFYKKMIQSEN